MAELEKVIKGLEYCVNAYPKCGEKCPYIHLCFNNGRQIQRDALELLKEQQQIIENLEYDLAVTKDSLNYYINGNN